MGVNEEGTLERLTEYLDLMSRSIEGHAGHVVDIAGDAILAEFSSVVAATTCAVEMQQLLKSRNEDLPPDRRLEFRIGIEMADIIAHGNSVYGNGVNIAARIQSLAEPGGICVSDAVRRAIANRLPVAFAALGEMRVKNIAEPVKVFRVLEQSEQDAPDKSSTVDSSPANRGTPIFTARRLAGVATVIALGGLLAVWQLYDRDTAPSSTPAPASTDGKQAGAATPTPAEKPSIAVLPFTNLSEDKEQEYFSDGISEDIIIDLSRVSNLRVIARNSSFSYKGQSVEPKDVGRELGVRYVLTGSVRRSGDRVRITAQLVDTGDSHQLWADKFDRKLQDIFALQDEITGRIVSALVVQLSSREQADLALKATQNVEAYDLFLKGQRLARQSSKENLEAAQTLYRQAIKLDPRFGRAYGALAMTLTRSMSWGYSERSQSALDQALELAKQAVSLDSSSPQTYWVLAYVHLHRGEGELALAAAQRSVELAPNYADGYALLALINNHAGRGREAIRLINRAMALNPLYTWEYPSNLGRGYYNVGEYAKAIVWFEKALTRNEFIGIPRIFMISCYVRLNRLDDASWEAEQLKVHNPQITLSQVRHQGLLWDSRALDRLLADLEQAGIAP